MVKNNQHPIIKTIDRLDPKAFTKWYARDFYSQNDESVRFTVTGEKFSGMIHIQLIDDFYKISAYTIAKIEDRKLLEAIKVDELIFHINKIING